MKKSQAVFEVSTILSEYRNSKDKNNLDLSEMIIERVINLGMKPPESKIKLQGIMPSDILEVSLNIWEDE